MSSQKFTNALASSHAHNKQLLLVILAIVFLAIFGIYFAWRQPKAVDIHIATDLRSGDTIRVVDGVHQSINPMSTALVTISGSKSIVGRLMEKKITANRFMPCSIS